MAQIASSPSAMHISNSKSPLRSIKAQPCEMVASEEFYADAQAHLVQWRKELVSSVGFEAQQGLRELCHEREHLKDLQADLAGVQNLVQVASQLQAGGARLAEVLHSSSEAAANRSQAVARMHEDLCASCERRRQEVQQEERKTTQQRALSDAQHAEALKLLAVYEDRLGLRISREAPQTVRMAFSLLDKTHPEREFHFTLGLAACDGESESYRVKECFPDVPELPHLLTELNKDACSSTSLPRFVCGMRRAFLKAAQVAQ